MNFYKKKVTQRTHPQASVQILSFKDGDSDPNQTFKASFVHLYITFHEILFYSFYVFQETNNSVLSGNVRWIFGILVCYHK